jgi:hypothetical protein
MSRTAAIAIDLAEVRLPLFFFAISPPIRGQQLRLP